jgi:eukaryotic-like serine/threonine-protein kinase
MTDYNPERWETLTNLLGEALSRPAGERGPFLSDACGGDDDLLAQVRGLLEAHAVAEADGRFERGAVDLFPDEIPGETVAEVGPYRLLREVGRGGMGTVWLAERADGLFRQRVAVKVMRGWTQGDEHRRRFEAERRILARLEHPGIARILDGGVDQAHRPYLVMEFVEGEPIDTYCASRELGVEARLALFRSVCEAVAYAHRNLVVHRDLKPSNILVTGEGREAAVKLLDFGIAKLLDSPDEEDAALMTATGTFPMTPEYAAPEQITSGPITPATDVYALGVTLFELLTGARPYRIEGRTPSAIEAAVCRSAPARPSTTVQTGPAGAGPALAPDRLARRLRGDLDTIILKALRKEPDRRYATAADLGEDLRRHAEGLPVAAQPDTARYRARKFVGRHRVSVAAAAAVLVALVVGLGAAVVQARVAAQERDRAERRFEIARETARTLLYDVDDALAAVPGTTAARETLVRQSLAYLDRLSHESAEDYALRLDIAHAYLRAGNILGVPADGSTLGDLEGARESYRRGLALVPNDPAGGLPEGLRNETIWVRALLLEKLAKVEAFSGQPDAALAIFRQTARMYATYVENDPDRIEALRALAVVHLHLGDYSGHPSFPGLDDPQVALAHYDTMLARLEPLRLRGDGMAPRLTGIAYERMGTIQSMNGDLDGALRIVSALVRDPPGARRRARRHPQRYPRRRHRAREARHHPSPPRRARRGARRLPSRDGRLPPPGSRGPRRRARTPDRRRRLPTYRRRVRESGR